jgi:tRNA (guanine-N7-)-methyltransferase
VLFPDPWPKKRHHKRRLITPEFLHIVGERLQPDGNLHIATDWYEYAEEIVNALDATPILRNQAGQLAYAERPNWRPVTKYEQRGLRLGHQVFDISAKKI